MSDEQKTPGEEQIATLLQMAGPRPRISEEVRARVRASVHEEWQRNVKSSRTRIAVWSAASVAAAAAIAFVMQRDAVEPNTPPAQPQIAAVVRKVDGAATGRKDGGAAFVLDEGTPLRAGESVETTAGAIVAFDWSGGSLRIAENSEFKIESPSALTLARGAVYFASAPGSRSVEVRTPFGVVRDVGTQFEVRLANDAVRVRVREGRVDLQRENRRQTAEAGTELAANANGEVVRRAISRTGADWEWVTRAAPPMILEGNVREIVANIAREKGLALEVKDPSISSMTVHGNVPLGPDEALDAAVSATGLRYRVSGETLVLERKK